VAGESTPEPEPAIDAERLAAEPELKPDPLLAQPQRGVEAAADQDLGQVGIAAILGQPAHIVEILLLGIGADIDMAQLVLADIGNEPSEVVKAVIDDAKRAAGKSRVAAPRLFRGDFQHQHAGAVLARRQCSAGRGIAGADDDDVAVFAPDAFHGLILARPSFSGAE
jgi:hypothetical protein